MTQYRKSKFFASACKSYLNLQTFGLLNFFMVMLEAENYDFIVLLWISFIIYQNLNLPYYAVWIFWASLFWNTVKFGNVMLIRNTFLECLLWWADSRMSPGLVLIKSEISPFLGGWGWGGGGEVFLLSNKYFRFYVKPDEVFWTPPTCQDLFISIIELH